MLVVPITGPEAKQALHEALDPRNTVNAVAFGDTQRAKDIADLAELRAGSHPKRRVIRIPSVGVLAGDPAFDQLEQSAAAGAEVVFLTRNLRVAMSLRGPGAVDAAEHETGFASALAGVIT